MGVDETLKASNSAPAASSHNSSAALGDSEINVSSSVLKKLGAERAGVVLSPKATPTFILPSEKPPLDVQTAQKSVNTQPDGSEDNKGIPNVSSGQKVSSTVKSLQDAFNSHLIRSQMRTRRKSRLDRQVMQDSPPTTSPPVALTSNLSTSDTTPKAAKNVSISSSSNVVQLPTPSYPFPNMTQKISFTMSPTGFSPYDRTLPSGSATPASVAFHPPGTNPVTPFQDPDFPSPNIYEIALALHSETGLEAFWGNLVDILCEHFRAERVSLAMPTDLTDLENTPWGQKATFNEADEDQSGNDNNISEFNKGRKARSHNTHQDKDSNSVARDSLSGGEDVTIENDLRGAFSPLVIEHESFNDQNTDVVEWADALERQSDGFYEGQFLPNEETSGTVFNTLQPLSAETEALIDSAGVIRVLERGKTVVLSREYRDPQTKWERQARNSESKTKNAIKHNTLAQTPYETPLEAPPPPMHTHIPITNSSTLELGRSRIPHKKPFPFASVDDLQLRRSTGRNNHSPPRIPLFEEYEQALTSPWSQSPAPSPAIRPDPNENPFFSPPNVDEDCFNPSVTSPEYSATEQVHAIGVESAATVIHIPLVHPASQHLNGAHRRSSMDSDDPDYVRKAPIAILSILSSVIPYPSNLVHCLSHLAPLVATAYSLSQAFTNLNAQLAHFQHSYGMNGPRQQLNERNMTKVSSIATLTSPSEYTKSSPSNSIIHTPSRDQSYAKAELEGSPAGTFDSESYFPSKQRKNETSQQTMSRPNDIMSSHNHTEYSTRKVARPKLNRMISEVLSKNAGKLENSLETKPASSTPSQHSSKRNSSHESGSLLVEDGSHLFPATTEHENRKNQVSFATSHVSRSDNANMKLDFTDIQPTSLSQWASSAPLQTPSLVPLPSSVPATPYSATMPQLHAFMPQDKPIPDNRTDDIGWTTYGYDDKSPSVKSSALNKISGPRELHNKSKSVHLDSSITGTTLISLENVEPQTGTLAIDDSTLTEGNMQDQYIHAYRKRLRRRHSSDNGTGPHTRLHSYGANFDVTFQTGAAANAGRNSNSFHRSVQPVLHPSHHPFMPPPSNKLLRTIIDAIPVHVFTAAPHTGDHTWVNSRVLTYRGVTAQEFMSDPFRSMHSEDRDPYLKSWIAAIRKGEAFSYQMRLRRFDGNYRWFMTRAVPLRDTKGTIVHWFGTNMDIHEQRLAEVDAARQAEMAESEMKYRSLANSSPQIVFAATAAMGITFANNQWIEYSGQTLDEALHLGFMEAVHPEDRQKCSLPGFSAQQFKKLAEHQVPGTWFSPEMNGSSSRNIHGNENTALPPSIKADKPKEDNQPPISSELRLKDRNGDYRWHLVRCVSVEANVEGLWFGTCTDINDHKLLEQKLKEANDAAQKSMESKTRFLSNMSHEIRTPLIGISGMVNFLLDTPLNGEQLDYCHTISSSSDGLLMVINDILDLSKVEAGMMRLTSEWFQVRSLVEDANELLSTMAISKELELNYLVEDDVPVTVSGDRVRLRQVILNIVGNAIKFTSKGEVFTRCYVNHDVEVADDEVMLAFECHDTGPGFDEKEEEFMFKRFSQIDGSSTRAHGGSGLGLVISRQLAELHGGHMNARSEKGKGSTFFFTAKCKLPSGDKTSTTNTDSIQNINPVRTQIISRQSDSSIRTTPSLAFSDTATPADSPASGPFLSATAASMFKANLPLNPVQEVDSMEFILPADIQQKYLNSTGQSRSLSSTEPPLDDARVKALTPPIFSILVVSSLYYSRQAIPHHIKMILPKTIPYHLTVTDSYEKCREFIKGEDPVVFTHIVVNLQDYKETIALVSDVTTSPMNNITTVVILSTPMQRTSMMESDPKIFEAMGAMVQFVYKPVKPSRLSVIFDPTKERDASTDRYRHTAQQVVDSQKAVFSDMQKEVGNRGHCVLLVEDNPVNQKVLLRFLKRVGMEVDIASDGEECVEKVHKNPPGQYCLILCDLHMPRKDGFAACSEIRQWEHEKGVAGVPIIALSANVMSDVADRCAEAGFSRYVTKPVNFKVLGQTIKDLLDPTKEHTLMQKQTPL